MKTKRPPQCNESIKGFIDKIWNDVVKTSRRVKILGIIKDKKVKV